MKLYKFFSNTLYVCEIFKNYDLHTWETFLLIIDQV